jgi:OOP family OmpA-OmpF porin
LSDGDGRDVIGRISTERMTAVGYGMMRPIASIDAEEGRAQNRRIEFEVK